MRTLTRIRELLLRRKRKVRGRAAVWNRGNSLRNSIKRPGNQGSWMNGYSCSGVGEQVG
jgi:hypothetical protein